MKTCNDCKNDLPGKAFRLPTWACCRACELARSKAYRKTAAYRLAKKRYRESEKGKAAERALARRPAVMEKRRTYSRSEPGKLSKKKYQKTEKGKLSLKAGIARYRASEKGKEMARQRDRKRAKLPTRAAQLKAASMKYHRSIKGKIRTWNREARKRGNPTDGEAALTSRDWKEIVSRQKGLCCWCGKKKKLTIDHVIPLSKGGPHTKTNVAAACLTCNVKKGNKVVTLF